MLITRAMCSLSLSFSLFLDLTLYTLHSYPLRFLAAAIRGCGVSGGNSEDKQRILSYRFAADGPFARDNNVSPFRAGNETSAFAPSLPPSLPPRSRSRISQPFSFISSSSRRRDLANTSARSSHQKLAPRAIAAVRGIGEAGRGIAE